MINTLLSSYSILGTVLISLSVYSFNLHTSLRRETYLMGEKLRSRLLGTHQPSQWRAVHEPQQPRLELSFPLLCVHLAPGRPGESPIICHYLSQPFPIFCIIHCPWQTVSLLLTVLAQLTCYPYLNINKLPVLPSWHAHWSPRLDLDVFLRVSFFYRIFPHFTNEETEAQI